MKKLCFITTVPMTIRAFVLPVVTYLNEETDWEITIICDDDVTLNQELPEGVRYIPVSMKRGISPVGIVSIYKIAEIFKNENFDLVQYSTPNAALYASIAAKLAGVKLRKYHLMGFRYLGASGPLRFVLKMLEKLSCKLSTDVECVSPSNMTLGIQEGIFPQEKVAVIWNGSSAGVDLERFDIKKREQWRKGLRDQLGYDEQNCVFGFAGRITGDKGINELLQAFQNISDPNKRLLLIGRVEEEQTLDRQLMDTAQNDPRVTFLPYTPDIEQYYAAMDVLVLPSYREGFGNVIIEAEAMGTPVIVTDIPGPIDAMEDQLTGLKVPVKDAEALCKAMERMMCHSLYEEYGENCNSFVKDHFDKDKLFPMILEDRKALFERGEAT